MTANDFIKKLNKMSDMNVERGCTKPEAANASRLIIKCFAQFKSEYPSLASRYSHIAKNAQAFLDSLAKEEEKTIDENGMDKLRAKLKSLLEEQKQAEIELNALHDAKAQVLEMLKKVEEREAKQQKVTDRIKKRIDEVSQLINGDTKKISRKERKELFNKIYELFISVTLKNGSEVNVTANINDEMLESLQITRQYFMIMFRQKAKGDDRIILESVRKKGTFISPKK